jgi:hypothetical protein
MRLFEILYRVEVKKKWSHPTYPRVTLNQLAETITIARHSKRDETVLIEGKKLN